MRLISPLLPLILVTFTSSQCPDNELGTTGCQPEPHLCQIVCQDTHDQCTLDNSRNLTSLHCVSLATFLHQTKTKDQHSLQVLNVLTPWCLLPPTPQTSWTRLCVWNFVTSLKTSMKIPGAGSGAL